MPTRFRDDETPVVEFDPRVEISPFALFRMLREDRAPLLVDVRQTPSARALQGARPYPGTGWAPQENEEVVLFDDDGIEALPVVRSLQARGYDRVKMLFGGLELYEFALSPDVVGSETFLVR